MLQNTLLGVTLLEDLITLLGVALQKVLKQFNGIASLIEDLQLVVKPIILIDFRSLIQWLESNNKIT